MVNSLHKPSSVKHTGARLARLFTGVCSVLMSSQLTYIEGCVLAFFMHCARSSVSLYFSIGSLIVMVTDWTVFFHRLTDVRITDRIALYNVGSSLCC